MDLDSEEDRPLCPYETEFYCDEEIDYDHLSTVSLDPVPLSDESSQDSLDDQTMDWMDHLLSEEAQCLKREQDLLRQLEQCRARRQQLRDQQSRCMQTMSRDECMAHYGLLWTADTICPQCQNPLRCCTSCEYHQHVASNGSIYISFGPVDTEACVLCLLDHAEANPL